MSGDLVDAGVMNDNPLAERSIKFGTRFSVDIAVSRPTSSGVVRTGWIYDHGSMTPRRTTLIVL